MLKHNPKSHSHQLGEKQPLEKETNSNGGQTKENEFEPFYYELDDLLKDITPEKMQEEISTGPAVGKEVF